MTFCGFLSQKAFKSFMKRNVTCLYPWLLCNNLQKSQVGGLTLTYFNSRNLPKIAFDWP